jgi:hypothetical protein
MIEVNILGMVKRELSQEEIEAKTNAVLALLKDQGERMREIDGHKRTIKLIKAKHDSVAGEIELERIDIERGYVWEDPPEPQQELPLENEAPTMPPPRTGQASQYERFEKEYPTCRNWPSLIETLRVVLSEKELQRFITEDDEPIVNWKVDSGVFNAVDNWARIELAHLDSEAEAKAGKPADGGMTIPARVEMPELLADIVLDKPKPKRGRKASGEQAPQA